MAETPQTAAKRYAGVRAAVGTKHPRGRKREGATPDRLDSCQPLFSSRRRLAAGRSTNTPARETRRQSGNSGAGALCAPRGHFAQVACSCPLNVCGQTLCSFTFLRIALAGTLPQDGRGQTSTPVEPPPHCPGGRRRRRSKGPAPRKEFPTTTLEMNAVANIFDMNGDGFIDYYEFVSALHPSRDVLRRTADADQIQDEVNRQVAQCSCARRFQVEQISANRYRFGESQQLRMVRILRSTLMVRVGGGWIALDEFLVKNDPCRVKGRTNLKINEKYLSPEPLAGKGGASSQAAPAAGASQLLSPSGSASSLSLCSSSSASAPSSPLARKLVLRRRTRSGDRGAPSRSSLATDGSKLAFAGAATEGTAGAEAVPPDPPGGPPP